MADKNLHDIKIDDLDNPKKTPLKNILTLLALLFIILVISVVITKLILNTDEGNKIETTEATAQVNSENSSNTTSDTKADETTQNSGVSASTISTAVAGAAAGAMLANTNNSTPLAERNVSVVKTETKKDDGTKTKVTLRERQPVKVKESTKKHTSTAKKPKPKHVVKKTPKKDTHKKQYIDKVVATKSNASHNRSIEGKQRAGHYIKVGTFKDVSTAIKKIKQTGLNYILVKPKNDKTMTRVLIGPFKSNWGAQQHLPSVQNNIAEGAYITRIK